jgi:hypothetical protein
MKPFKGAKQKISIDLRNHEKLFEHSFGFTFNKFGTKQSYYLPL